MSHLRIDHYWFCCVVTIRKQSSFEQWTVMTSVNHRNDTNWIKNRHRYNLKSTLLSSGSYLTKVRRRKLVRILLETFLKAIKSTRKERDQIKNVSSKVFQNLITIKRGFQKSAVIKKAQLMTNSFCCWTGDLIDWD